LSARTSAAAEPRICAHEARVADGRAIYRLLAGVPRSEEIRFQLSRPYFARRWEQATQRSFWISSNGDMATCLTLSGLSADETVAIWISADEQRLPHGSLLSALCEVIRAELGLAVELMN
jgi:hypothetical protein